MQLSFRSGPLTRQGTHHRGKTEVGVREGLQPILDELLCSIEAMQVRKRSLGQLKFQYQSETVISFGVILIWDNPTMTYI